MDETEFEKLLQGLQHKDPAARRYAAHFLLSHYPHEHIHRAADALLVMLEQKSWSVMLLLGKMREQRAVEPLIKLLNDPYYKIWDAPWALGYMGDKQAIEPLLALLKTAQRYDKLAYMEALGRLKAQEAVPLLIDIFESDDGGYYDRAYAAIALGRIGDTRAIEPLAHFLQDIHPTPYRGWHRTHLRVIEALADIGDEKVIEPLLDVLERSRNYQPIQSAVVRALVKIGQPAVEPLLDTLNHPASWVRANALIALNRIGDPKAIEPIKPLLHDKNRRVRRQAAYALRKLGHDPDPQE